MLHLSSLKNRRRHLLPLIAGCLYISAVYAGGEEVPVPPTIGLFPYVPGVSLYGFGGNGWTATGDVMAPVVGVPQNFTFVDPQIYYHSNPDDYTASVGAGQRWLNNNTTGILGAYVFGDYNHLSDGNGFWFVSPGIERLGQTFDFSLNGYIPVSSQRINNDVLFADQLGNFSEVNFTGHTQYDELVQTFDSTGWGLTVKSVCVYRFAIPKFMSVVIISLRKIIPPSAAERCVRRCRSTIISARPLAKPMTVSFTIPSKAG